MDKILVGIDIGTSGCKVAAFNLDGHVIARSARSYKVCYPRTGFVEQNPGEWWEAVCEAVQETLIEGKIKPGNISGIGVDGQSWSAIPVDRYGNVLNNTPIWMDTRSSEIASKTVEEFSFERIFRTSGNSFEPTYSTPKILWFRENMPGVYQNTYKFLQSNSYIVYRLTNKFTQDRSQGYGLHVFNMEKGEYDDALCRDMGIDRSKLPEIYACHDVVGEVTRDAASMTGLKAGTPVAAGGLDAACGTLGAGVYQKGQTQEQGGQAGGMSICLDKAVSHPRLILSFHVVPGLWLLQGGTVGGGGTIKWFRQELGAFEEHEEKIRGVNAFKIMDEEAAEIAPGSDGLIFLPYMAGERSPIWDENARGIFFGLGYDKTRAHMIRAMLEGCAFALLHNLKTAEGAGVAVNDFTAIGGAANSRLWTQIKSDVTGKVIRVPSSDTATTQGAAILAGVGTGMYRSFKEAVERTVQITRVHEPNIVNYRKYQKQYEIYLEIYERLKGTMKRFYGGDLIESSSTVCKR